MIGTTTVAVSVPAGRLSHGRQSVTAVRAVRVGVQDASDVGVGDEAREPPGLCEFDVTSPFPQLGLDKGQAEGLVDVSLGLRNHLLVGVQPAFVKPQHRVFSMYHHVKKLMYTVRVDEPDPTF